LRLDYAPGPPHAFWTTFQRGIKQRYPNALTLGEITAPLAEVATYAGRMDAFMDFALAEMMRNVFARRTAALATLLDYLDARAAELPAEMGRATLLDNHDMHRFLWLAEGDTRRLKLAVVCQMTLDGAPIVYYGTEVGLSQYADAGRENAYARAPMIWDERQDRDVLAYFQRVIALRHAYPALRRGRRVRLEATVVGGMAPDGEDGAQVGAYARELDGDAVMVVLNNTEHAVSVRVSLAGIGRWAGTAGAAGDLRNLLAPQGEDAVPVEDGTVRLELPALGAAMLV
jgi:cyclomaltodextrinase / maltogenic alpha-amylase / neopullulanase